MIFILLKIFPFCRRRIIFKVNQIASEDADYLSALFKQNFIHSVWSHHIQWDCKSSAS